MKYSGAPLEVGRQYSEQAREEIHIRNIVYEF